MRAQSRMSLMAGMALVVLVVCGQLAKAEEDSATSPEKGRILTEEQFRANLVGKKIDLGQGYAINHENGKITGKLGNKKTDGKMGLERRILLQNSKTRRRENAV